jgi:collagenase-like PrtC family protease
MPLTSHEIAAGQSHGMKDIEFADDGVLTVSLRRKPTEAFIVGCYCTLCNARRAAHWRRSEQR